jgi:hypothetical protein
MNHKLNIFFKNVIKVHTLPICIILIEINSLHVLVHYVHLYSYYIIDNHFLIIGR